MKDCELCSTLTSDQKPQLAIPTCKARKEKKTATPQLVDPGSVQILGEVNASLSDRKWPQTRGMLLLQKNQSHLLFMESRHRTELSDRYSRLEAMLIAKTYNQLLVSLLFNRSQCQYHSIRDSHWLVYLLQILVDHSCSQLLVPVRCQWRNLSDQSAGLLSVRLLPVPVRNISDN